MLKMSFSTLSVAFLAISVISAGAQQVFPGKCPEQQVVQNFDVGRYLGKWYEIERYFTFFEIGGMCIEANYSDRGNGTVTVLNTQIQQDSGEFRSIEGYARLTTDDGSAKLGVTFPTIPNGSESPYWVLDTDYGNHSLVWSCGEVGLNNFQFVWFLSREPNPSGILREKVHNLMDQVGIRRDLLITTNQTNCDQGQF